MEEEEISIIWIFCGYTKKCLLLSEAKLSSRCLIVVTIFLVSSKTLWTTWIKKILSVEWWKRLFSFPSCESVNQTKDGGSPATWTGHRPATCPVKQQRGTLLVQCFVSFSSVLVSHNYWRKCLALSLLHVPLCSPAGLLLCVSSSWSWTVGFNWNGSWKPHCDSSGSKPTQYSHCPAKQWAETLYKALQIIFCRCDPFHIVILYTEILKILVMTLAGDLPLGSDIPYWLGKAFLWKKELPSSAPACHWWSCRPDAAHLETTSALCGTAGSPL